MPFTMCCRCLIRGPLDWAVLLAGLLGMLGPPRAHPVTQPSVPSLIPKSLEQSTIDRLDRSPTRPRQP